MRTHVKKLYRIFGMSAKTVLLLMFTTLMAVTSYATAQYPPSYLHLPALWSSMAAISSVLMFAALFTRKRVDVIQAAGWATALTATSRGMAIGWEVVRDWPPVEAIDWSFLVASAQWLVTGVTVAIVWSFAPWAWGLPSVGDDDSDV